MAKIPYYIFLENYALELGHFYSKGLSQLYEKT